MFFNKIKAKESGILLYGITPPKAITTREKVAEIAEKTLNTLCTLDIDALTVYDVQDESDRTSEERPFPFANSMDPFEFATAYLDRLTVPKIIYRSAGKFTKDELSKWLHGLNSHGFHPVFVGLQTPDAIPITSLKDAYDLWRNYQDTSVIGAVTIPERHAILKDEDIRILDKVSSGVSFFISQCIFNVEYTKKTLEDLASTCQQRKQDLPTIIFTLTICGSAKTLQFMEWLGIHIPDDIKKELIASDSPVNRSVEIAISIAKDLINFCEEKSIPFGFNIESVAIRKEEIEASHHLLNTVAGLLRAKGLRRSVVQEEVVVVNQRPA